MQAVGRAGSTPGGSPSPRPQLWMRDGAGGSCAGALWQDGAPLPRTVADLWHYLQMGMQRVEVRQPGCSPKASELLCGHVAAFWQNQSCNPTRGPCCGRVCSRDQA